MNKCKDCKYFDIERDAVFLNGEVDTSKRACILISTDFSFNDYERSEYAEIEVTTPYKETNEALFIVSQHFGCAEWDKKDILE